MRIKLIVVMLTPEVLRGALNNRGKSHVKSSIVAGAYRSGRRYKYG
jgi:hypothetical protein